MFGFEQLSSMVMAGNAVEAIIDKVMHIKYMEEIEKKITPHTICHTLIQSLKVVNEV